MFKNRLTLGYIVLVSLPLLLLLGTLHAGRALTAPPAVSGEWIIQPGDARSGDPLPPALSISQTGPELVITFHDPSKTRFQARVESAHIAGSAVSGLRLDAVLVAHRTIEARLFETGCPSCTPVSFRAIKSSAQER